MYEATEKQIQEWKNKHGKVYAVSVEDENGEMKRCYLKKPSRKAMSYASAVASTDPIKFEELLLNDMWLGGDEESKNDDEMFLAVGAEISEIVKIKKAQLVNC